jgi:hypothetical protein
MARQLVYVSDPVCPCVRMTGIKTDLQCQHKLVSSLLNTENNRPLQAKFCFARRISRRALRPACILPSRGRLHQGQKTARIPTCASNGNRSDSFLIHPVVRTRHRELDQVDDVLCDLLSATRTRKFRDFTPLRGQGKSLRGLLDCWEGPADQRAVAVPAMRMDAAYSGLVIAWQKFRLTRAARIWFFQRGDIFNGSRHSTALKLHPPSDRSWQLLSPFYQPWRDKQTNRPASVVRFERSRRGDDQCDVPAWRTRRCSSATLRTAARLVPPGWCRPEAPNTARASSPAIRIGDAAQARRQRSAARLTIAASMALRPTALGARCAPAAPEAWRCRPRSSSTVQGGRKRRSGMAQIGEGRR